MMGFMAKKSFNPMNQENQKKRWIAEQKEKERMREEKERQRRLQQERNRESLFKAGSSKDPKHSQVGFMYQAPPGFVGLMEQEERDKEKAAREEAQPECARNAPTEGTYTKDIQMRPKPFGKQYSTRRCLRCGEVGHLTGARECPMKDALPANDGEQKAMEDPLEQMKSRLGEVDDRLVMKQHLQSKRIGRKDAIDHDLVPSDDEDIDVEEDMLESLSSREKRRLRKYLKKQARKEEKERKRIEKEARLARRLLLETAAEEEWVEAEPSVPSDATEDSPPTSGTAGNAPRDRSDDLVEKHDRRDNYEPVAQSKSSYRSGWREEESEKRHNSPRDAHTSRSYPRSRSPIRSHGYSPQRVGSGDYRSLLHNVHSTSRHSSGSHKRRRGESHGRRSDDHRRRERESYRSPDRKRTRR